MTQNSSIDLKLYVSVPVTDAT